MVATAVYISSTPSEDCAARGEQDFLVDEQPKNGKVQWLRSENARILGTYGG